MNEDEFDQLTNEQIDDLLRQHGYDPAKVETTGRVFAEICLGNVRLRRQVAEAQAQNERLAADLRWHEIWIAEHQERIERLTAERDDLAAKLEAAQAVLALLRDGDASLVCAYDTGADWVESALYYGVTGAWYVDQEKCVSFNDALEKFKAIVDRRT